MTLINQVKEFAQTHPKEYFTIDDLLNEFPERSRATLAASVASLKHKGILVIVKEACPAKGQRAHYKYTQSIEKKVFVQKNMGQMILSKQQLAEAVEQIFINFTEKIEQLKKENMQIESKNLQYSRKNKTLEDENLRLKDEIVILKRKINVDAHERYNTVSIPSSVDI